MTQARTRLDHAFPQPQSQNRFDTECTMAPTLSAFQHDLIDAMIKQNLPNEIIAKEAECHERTITWPYLEYRIKSDAARSPQRQKMLEARPVRLRLFLVYQRTVLLDMV